jgi:hypothetical protein
VVASRTREAEARKERNMSMPKRYKIKGRYVPLGEYLIPSEALELTTEISRIELALALLKQVSETNITSNLTTEDREFGRRIKWITIRQIETWKHFSQMKLRNEYLAK